MGKLLIGAILFVPEQFIMIKIVVKIIYNIFDLGANGYTVTMVAAWVNLMLLLSS